MQKSLKLSQGSNARRRRVRIILRPIREVKGLRPVSLRSGRHEIGSDPQCGICLAAPGIDLKHCEITVRRDSVSVRAWSRFTWINDGVVKEGALRPGDRLSLGPVEFEVVTPKHRRRSRPDTGTLIRPFIDQSAVQKSLKAAIERTERALSEHRLKIAEELEATSVAENLQHNRQERLAAAQIERALLDRRASLIQELRGDLLRQLGDLIQRETLASERERSTIEESARIEGRRKALEEQSSTLDGIRTELRAQQERVTHERAEIGIATQELNSVRERLNDERVRIAAENAAVETARVALSHRATELDRQSQFLDRRSEEIEASEASIASQVAESARQDAALGLRAGELEDWTQRIAASESQLTDRCRLAAESQQALEILRTELQQERETLNAEKDAVTLERRALEELVSTTQARKERIDHRATELAELESTIAGSLAEIASARGELEQRGTDLEMRQRDLANRETELTVANEQIALAESRHREVAIERAELERRAAELSHDVQRLQDERSAIAREQDRLSIAAADLADREARLTASITTSQETQNQVHLEQVESIAEVNRLRELLTDEESNLAGGRAELEAARITLRQDEENLAERHRALELTLANVEARAAEIEHLREHIDRESEALESRRREYEAAWSSRPLEQDLPSIETGGEQSPQADSVSELHQQIEKLQMRLAEFERSIESERTGWNGERDSLIASTDHVRNELSVAATQAAELDARRRDLETELAAVQEQAQQEREAFNRARETWDAEQDLLIRDRMALEAEWQRLESRVNEAYSPPPIPTAEIPVTPSEQIAVDEFTPPPIPQDEFAEAQPIEPSEEFHPEAQAVQNYDLADDQFSQDGFQLSQSPSQSDEQTWNAEAINSGAEDDVLKLRAELASLFGIQPGLGADSAEASHDQFESDPGADAIDESAGPESEAFDTEYQQQSDGTEFQGEGVENLEAPAVEEATSLESTDASSDADPSSMFDETSSAEDFKDETKEESHEEIMTAYLDRILGRNRETQPALTHPKASPTPQAHAPAAHHQGEASEAPRQARRLNDEEKVALRANMDSFRELANKQARAAVAKHKTNELKSGMQLTSVICVLVAVVGIVLLTAELWSSTSYRGLGVLTLSVAGAMGMWILANTIKIRQLQALQNFAKEEPGSEDTTVPSDGAPAATSEPGPQPEAASTSAE